MDPPSSQVAHVPAVGSVQVNSWPTTGKKAGREPRQASDKEVQIGVCMPSPLSLRSDMHGEAVVDCEGQEAAVPALQGLPEEILGAYPMHGAHTCEGL